MTEPVRSTIDPNTLNSLRQQADKTPQAAIRKAAQEFEALFVQMLLKQMRQMSLQAPDGTFSNDDNASATYQSLFDQQMSRVMSGSDVNGAGDASDTASAAQTSTHRGLGLADIIARQLSRQTAGESSAVPVTGQPAGLAPSTLSFAARPQRTATNAAVGMPAGMPTGTSTGVSTDTKTQFIQRFLPTARKIEAKTGIAAEYLLGQAALESGWGQREILNANGTPSFNLFGIKATGGWTGATTVTATTEYAGQQKMAVNDRFRAYDSYEASFEDWAKLIHSSPRYQSVASGASTAADFAYGLQKAGYATDPQYGNKLLNVIAQAQQRIT